MIAELKEEISAKRMNGEGYKLIASELGLNLNSVRSYCRRNGLGGFGVCSSSRKCIKRAPRST